MILELTAWREVPACSTWKNQTSREFKKKVTEMKHTLDGITSRLDTSQKEKLNGFGDTAIETIRNF